MAYRTTNIARSHLAMPTRKKAEAALGLQFLKSIRKIVGKQCRLCTGYSVHNGLRSASGEVGVVPASISLARYWQRSISFWAPRGTMDDSASPQLRPMDI